MYGYIRQGRRTELTREIIGGVPFWVLTAGEEWRRGMRVRRLLRRMAQWAVKTAVFQEETWRETAARYGIQPPAVGPLRLAKLEELLAQVAPAGMQDGTVRLCTDGDGAAARRAAAVLAQQARYIVLEPPEQAGLSQWLLAQYGLAAGSGGRTPALTVYCGAAAGEGGAAVYLGPDCAARQQVVYEAEGLTPWPVTEELLAALLAAGRWEPSEIHVASVRNRA